MNREQVAILFILFILTFSSYVFIKRKFTNVSIGIKINLIFLIFGTAGAVIITPFIYPYDFYNNLLVLTVIPLAAYNFYWLTNIFSSSLRIGTIMREIIALLSILTGAFIGIESINLTGLTVFRVSDIKDTLLIAFFFNTGRVILSYADSLRIINIKRQEVKVIRQKEQESSEKLERIYSKINPHFLYNSLNSIAGLAMEDGKKTRDMTIALSKLLRYSLSYTDNNFATIEEEAECIKTYFDVEKIRFEDRLEYEINIPEETKNFLIPKFLLQPLAENCIKHAFTEITERHVIKVGAQVINSELFITVSDNGKPFPEKIIPGYGLKNVNDKLDLLFQGKYELEITNRPEKRITIILKNLKERNGN